MVEVVIERIPGNEDLPLPRRMTPGSSGMDIFAAVKEDLVIPPGKWALIPAGFRIAINPGYEGQIRPRSGLALKYGVTLLNSPGTIDSDYRGEVKIILINLGEEDFIVKRGDRIAQLVIAPVEYAKLVEIKYLPETSRDSGGFGHTGK